MSATSLHPERRMSNFYACMKMRKCIVFLVWIYRLLLVVNLLMVNTVYEGVHGTSLVHSQLFGFWEIQPVIFLRKKKETSSENGKIPLLTSAPQPSMPIPFV